MTGILTRSIGITAATRRRPVPLPSYVTSLRSRSIGADTNVLGALTGVAVGDILLAFVAGSTQTSSITPPSGLGWTQIGDSGTGVGGDAGRMYVYATTATSTNQTGGTWTWTGVNGDHWVSIVAYRHVTLPSTAGVNKVAASRTATSPSATSVGANAVALFGGFVTNGISALGWSGSMTSRILGGSASTDGAISEEALPTAGATGTRTLTSSTTGTTATATSVATVILEAA